MRGQAEISQQCTLRWGEPEASLRLDCHVVVIVHLPCCAGLVEFTEHADLRQDHRVPVPHTPR
eukprot:6360891-Lingulodinium_polyedra.AAC.1